MWQSNRPASNSYQYYSGDVSSYNQNIHQPLMTQSDGYQPSHGASGWGQSAQNGSITSPVMHRNSIGTSSHPFSSGGSSGYYNEHRQDRNSVFNPGSGHVVHGQGSWHPENLSSKALPSPVFQNELSGPAPSTWPTQESGSNSIHYGRGFTNNLYHNHAHGPTPPMEGYQPMQFNPSSHRPNIPGPPGRGSYSQNHRGGQGSIGRGRGSNQIGAGRGRGKKKMPRPAKSTGKSKEAWHSLAHVCDPCERWFNDEEQLAKHVSEHRTCGIDGCKLTAHSGVIDKHIKMQHDTGLFQKMKHMVLSDDFAKWRAERKLKYPSRENIVKRQEEQEEKIKRGESIGNENGRSIRFRGANHKRHLRREKSRQWRAGINQNPAEVELQDNLVSNKFLNTNIKDKKSKPCSAIDAKMPLSHSIDEEQIKDNLSNEDKAFSDTEWEPVPEAGDGKPAAGVPKLSAALNTLAAMYDSDSDGDSNTGSLTPMKIANVNDEPRDESISEGADSPIEMPICRLAVEKEAGGREEKEDSEIPRKVSNKRSNQLLEGSEEKSKQRKMNHRAKNVNSYKRKPDVSLLQKLLASEIRHERNVVLQCIRYIVENNFLAETPLEKAQKIDCGPETTLSNTEMNLASPVEVTKLGASGVFGGTRSIESTQSTCAPETAVCDTKMDVSSIVHT